MISSPSVMEGDSGSTSLTYTVTLSAASGREVTVRYADAGLGTATSGTDYTAITAGTLTFATGTTSRTFDVSVTGDTVNEFERDGGGDVEQRGERDDLDARRARHQCAKG